LQVRRATSGRAAAVPRAVPRGARRAAAAASGTPRGRRAHGRSGARPKTGAADATASHDLGEADRPEAGREAGLPRSEERIEARPQAEAENGKAPRATERRSQA